MTLLQWSLLWVLAFVTHAQVVMAVTKSRGEVWNKGSSVTFATVIAIFVLSLLGARGLY